MTKEGRLEKRVRQMALELAREHQQELAAAGTLLDLEELTCQIGDELTRVLTQQELVRRGQQQDEEAVACPDCGGSCPPQAEPEPVVLAGLRGELAYQQPKHFCDRCRRSFFPSGGPVGIAGAEHGDDRRAPASRLGGSQSD